MRISKFAKRIIECIYYIKRRAFLLQRLHIAIVVCLIVFFHVIVKVIMLNVLNYSHKESFPSCYYNYYHFLLFSLFLFLMIKIHIIHGKHPPKSIAIMVQSFLPSSSFNTPFHTLHSIQKKTKKYKQKLRIVQMNSLLAVWVVGRLVGGFSSYCFYRKLMLKLRIERCYLPLVFSVVVVHVT